MCVCVETAMPCVFRTYACVFLSVRWSLGILASDFIVKISMLLMFMLCDSILSCHSSHFCLPVLALSIDYIFCLRPPCESPSKSQHKHRNNTTLVACNFAAAKTQIGFFFFFSSSQPGRTTIVFWVSGQRASLTSNIPKYYFVHLYYCIAARDVVDSV